MYVDPKVTAIVGPDGSGKSQFGREFSRRTGSKEVTIPGYRGDAPWPIRLVGSFLEDLFASVGHRFQNKSLVKASYVGTVLLQNVLDAYLRKSGDDWSVQRHAAIDGPVYSMVKYNGDSEEISRELTAKMVEKVHKYLDALPGEVICVLPPSPEESYRRIQERDEKPNRGSSFRETVKHLFRGNSLEMHENPEDLQRAEDAYREVLTYLNQEYGIGVTYVYSDKPTPQMVDEVLGTNDYASRAFSELDTNEEYAVVTV